MSNSLEKAFNGSALNYKPSWVYARVRAVTGTKHIGYYMQCIRIFSGRGSIVTAKEGNTIISKDYGSYLEYVEQLSHVTMAEPPLRPKSPLAVSVLRDIFCPDRHYERRLSPSAPQRGLFDSYLLQNMFLGRD